MKADAVSLLAIFEKKMRLEVPLFQRQYVWTKEQQWEPLWEDIERKFSDYLDGRKDTPVHFLGAIVLESKADTHNPCREATGHRWATTADNTTGLSLRIPGIFAASMIARTSQWNATVSRSTAA